MYKHKAIFKGRVKEVVWYVRDNIEYLEDLERRLEISTERFRRDGGMYEQQNIVNYTKRINSFERTVKVYKDEMYLKHEDIWSGQIPRPILDVDEEIYINDLNIIVRVDRKYRTTNDEVMYETNHHVKTVETERTKTSRLNAVEKWFETLYPSYSKFEELKSEFIVEEPVEEVVEEPVERTEYVPPWEREENKKKENTWFGWFGKKKG